MWSSVGEDRRIAFCDFSVDGFLGVSVDPRLLTVWHIGVSKNSGNRAFWDAGTAINAFVRVDDEVGVGFSERFHRANGNAFLILVVNARGRNDVGHGDSSFG